MAMKIPRSAKLREKTILLVTHNMFRPYCPGWLQRAYASEALDLLLGRQCDHGLRQRRLQPLLERRIQLAVGDIGFDEVVDGAQQFRTLVLHGYAHDLLVDDVLDLELVRIDRKSTRLNSSHSCASRMPSSA